MIKSLTLRTRQRIEVVDITSGIRRLIEEAGGRDGICLVYVPHTTAGVTINEGADPDVMRDFLNKLNDLVPASGRYSHTEGNADAHIKASMIGSSASVIVEKGVPLLGTWQSIFFCEFDGPRERRIFVKVIEG